MHLLEKSIATPELCKATDVSPIVLQNWIKRDLIGRQDFMPVGVEGGGKQGQTRRFSYTASIHIAVANALLAAGLSDVKRAFLMAGGFAVTAAGPNAPGPVRLPGLPFHYSLGRTLLVVSGEYRAVLLDDKAGDLFARMSGAAGSPGFVALDVFPAFVRVCQAFGEDAAAVLDEAYSFAPPPEQAREAG